MKKTKNYLAIDLGASSGRGIVGSFDGEKITLRENHRFSNDPVSVNGRLYWDILRIFYEIKQSLTKTVLEKDDVVSVGIDTWGVDYALLNKSGRMISMPVHYRDTRTVGVPEEVNKILPLDELYAKAGIQVLNFNTIFQLFAESREDPDALSHAQQLLQIPDLLNYFLTGKRCNEYTILSTGALLDARKRDYAFELTDKLGIPRKIFGEVVQPCADLGELLPAVQSEVGKTSAHVVTVASHDTASAVVAVPSSEENFIYISSGTWSLMGTELSEPLITEESKRLNFTNEGGFEGKIRFLKNIMGLWLTQESRRQWRREGTEYSFAELEELAKKAEPFRSLINPDDPAFSVPGDLPGRIREFCKKTNQPIPETVGQVIRCIYESLALKYRMTVESIESLTNRKTSVIHVVGGGTRDEFLSQMTADACNIPVAAGPQEATAIGNIAVQAIADGSIKNLAEARKIIAASFPLKHYEPTKERRAWDEAYKRFGKL